MREQPQSSTSQKDTAILEAIAKLQRTFDEFARAYLNARFPYGDGKTDRWSRRQ